MACKLYVGNIPNNTSDSEMRDLFGSFGEVEEVAVFNKRDDEPGAGYAFVHFEKAEDADEALDALDSTEFHKNVITVQVARTKGHGYGRGSGPPRPPGMRGPPHQHSYGGRRDRPYRSDYRDSGMRHGGGRDSYHREPYRERGGRHYMPRSPPSREYGGRSSYREGGRDKGRYGRTGGGDREYFDKYERSGRYERGGGRYEREKERERDHYDEYNGRGYSEYRGRSRSPPPSREYYKSDRGYDSHKYKDEYREEGSSRRRW